MNWISSVIILGIFASWSGAIFAATVGKVGAGGTVLFVKFSEDETEKYEAGLQIKITYDGGETSGIILSKKGTKGRLRLDEPTQDIMAKMELTLVPAEGEEAAAAVSTTPAAASTFPAGAAISLSRSPVSPFYTYANTGGKANSDGSSTDLFDTFGLVTANTKIQYLFLINQVQVGPEFSYFSTTNKLTNSSTVEGQDSDSVEVQIKYSLFEAGFIARYMFMPYVPQKIVPTAGLGFSIGQYARTIGDKGPQKASTQVLKVQFGIQYMLTSTFAFDASFEYRSDSIRFTETETVTVETASAEKSEDISQKISSTGLIYGLCFYF